jgi:hypothetical protein
MLTDRFLNFGSSDKQLIEVKTDLEDAGKDTKLPKKKQSRNRRKNSEILASKNYIAASIFRKLTLQCNYFLTS